jgi:phosphatidate cytidylyltransferase
MKRVLTAVVLLPFLIFIIEFASPLFFTLLMGVSALLALQEFFSLAKKSGMEPYSLPGHVLALALIASFHLCSRNQSTAALLLLLAALSFLGLGLSRGDRLTQVLPGAAATLLGLVYIPTALGLLITVRSNTSLGRDAPHWIFFFLSAVWLGDTAAYCVGQTLGRHKLAPVISPKKTIEGALGGLLGSALAALLGKKILVPGASLLGLLFLSGLMGVASQFGDLAESALKRGAGIKDSSNLLPGHGGLLDRIDGVLFAAPVLFGYTRFFL